MSDQSGIWGAVAAVLVLTLLLLTLAGCADVRAVTYCATHRCDG